jgi:hypothetical protein
MPKADDLMEGADAVVSPPEGSWGNAKGLLYCWKGDYKEGDTIGIV